MRQRSSPLERQEWNSESFINKVRFVRPSIETEKDPIALPFQVECYLNLLFLENLKSSVALEALTS